MSNIHYVHWKTAAYYEYLNEISLGSEPQSNRGAIETKFGHENCY